jgi:hypothetical protein
VVLDVDGIPNLQRTRRSRIVRWLPGQGRRKERRRLLRVRSEGAVQIRPELVADRLSDGCMAEGDENSAGGCSQQIEDTDCERCVVHKPPEPEKSPTNVESDGHDGCGSHEREGLEMELQNFVKRELSKTAHNADREKLIRWLMSEDGTRWYEEQVPRWRAEQMVSPGGTSVTGRACRIP